MFGGKWPILQHTEELTSNNISYTKCEAMLFDLLSLTNYYKNKLYCYDFEKKRNYKTVLYEVAFKKEDFHLTVNLNHGRRKMSFLYSIIYCSIRFPSISTKLITIP